MLPERGPPVAIPVPCPRGPLCPWVRPLAHTHVASWRCRREALVTGGASGSFGAAVTVTAASLPVIPHQDPPGQEDVPNWAPNAGGGLGGTDFMPKVTLGVEFLPSAKEDLLGCCWDATGMSPWRERRAPPGETSLGDLPREHLGVPGDPHGRWGMPAGGRCKQTCSLHANVDGPSLLGLNPITH